MQVAWSLGGMATKGSIMPSSAPLQSFTLVSCKFCNGMYTLPFSPIVNTVSGMLRPLDTTTLKSGSKTQCSPFLSMLSISALTILLAWLGTDMVLTKRTRVTLSFGSVPVRKGLLFALKNWSPSKEVALVPNKHPCSLSGCTITGTQALFQSAWISTSSWAVHTSSCPPLFPSLPYTLIEGLLISGSGFPVRRRFLAISCSILLEIMVAGDPQSTTASTGTPSISRSRNSVGPTTGLLS